MHALSTSPMDLPGCLNPFFSCYWITKWPNHHRLKTFHDLETMYFPPWTLYLRSLHQDTNGTHHRCHQVVGVGDPIRCWMWKRNPVVYCCFSNRPQLGPCWMRLRDYQCPLALSLSIPNKKYYSTIWTRRQCRWRNKLNKKKRHSKKNWNS